METRGQHMSDIELIYCLQNLTSSVLLNSLNYNLKVRFLSNAFQSRSSHFNLQNEIHRVAYNKSDITISSLVQISFQRQFEINYIADDGYLF